MALLKKRGYQILRDSKTLILEILCPQEPNSILPQGQWFSIRELNVTL